MDFSKNYDVENRKLTNVTDGTNSTDAITKKQLDAIDFETITKDINLDNK